MSQLILDGLTKRFGDVRALSGLSLEVAPGEVVALLGSSGAGKSTTLKIAAGVERPTEGRVLLGGEDITATPAWQRDAAMAFESYVLYPQLPVFDNIAFPLRAPRLRGRYDADEIRRRVEQVAGLVEIGHLLGRRPVELSGGQRQRVALSRALVRDAAIVLLDEPISHLDAKLRHWLRGELRRLLTSRSSPAIWATPDGLEAMGVADRIAVVVDGRVVQHGTPQEIFRSPATVEAARLLGDPGMSILEGALEDGRVVLEGAGGASLPLSTSNGQIGVRGPVRLGIRPGELRIAGGAGVGRFQAEVLAAEAGARQTVVIARVGRQVLRIATPDRRKVRAGDRIWVDCGGARIHLFSTDRDGRIITEANVVSGSPRSTYDSQGVSS